MFLGHTFIFLVNSQTMHIKSILHNSIAMFFPKKLVLWRDSNPGLLFLTRFGYFIGAAFVKMSTSKLSNRVDIVVSEVEIET
jgi:hypothetical protein